MTIKLTGNWAKGSAYDIHTLSSVYLGADEHGHDHWDSQRSEMGQLLYQLKYKNNLSTVSTIVGLLLSTYKGLETKHAIIPIAASRSRTTQPVAAVAKTLGASVGVPVYDALIKQPNKQELKNITDATERMSMLRGLITFDTANYDISGKNVLLLDDLYRSGATLTVATEVLLKAGAKSVVVLTLTKTRSKT